MQAETDKWSCKSTKVLPRAHQSIELLWPSPVIISCNRSTNKDLRRTKPTKSSSSHIIKVASPSEYHLWVFLINQLFLDTLACASLECFLSWRCNLCATATIMLWKQKKSEKVCLLSSFSVELGKKTHSKSLVAKAKLSISL